MYDAWTESDSSFGRSSAPSKLERGREVRDDLRTMLRVVRFLLRRREDGPAGRALVPVDPGDHPAEGEIRRVTGLPVVLCRAGGRLYALGLLCPHAGALLTQGRIVGDCIECPLHGARFALDDGTVRRGPAGRALRAYEVVEADGRVHVTRRRRR
jgi:nitrite reductase/ring-hydroxylating ferredoxin subunit